MNYPYDVGLCVALGFGVGFLMVGTMWVYHAMLRAGEIMSEP